jgi:hypothetical protein
MKCTRAAVIGARAALSNKCECVDRNLDTSDENDIKTIVASACRPTKIAAYFDRFPCVANIAAYFDRFPCVAKRRSQATRGVRCFPFSSWRLFSSMVGRNQCVPSSPSPSLMTGLGQGLLTRIRAGVLIDVQQVFTPYAALLSYV